jgi:hypothetical protein
VDGFRLILGVACLCIFVIAAVGVATLGCWSVVTILSLGAISPSVVILLGIVFGGGAVAGKAGLALWDSENKEGE